jgi:PPOX class probable F420-dependent enzyme
VEATIDRVTNTGLPTLAQHLAGARYCNLTTYRKSGEAVATPVWFALVDDRAYVVTDANAGKVRRIRNNGRARLAPSDWRGRPTGGERDAAATIVIDPAESAIAERALRERYGWQWRAITWFGQRRRSRSGAPDTRAYLAITAR